MKRSPQSRAARVAGAVPSPGGRSSGRNAFLQLFDDASTPARPIPLALLAPGLGTAPATAPLRAAPMETLP
jgi:hypothetical protein